MVLTFTFQLYKERFPFKCVNHDLRKNLMMLSTGSFAIDCQRWILFIYTKVAFVIL